MKRGFTAVPVVIMVFATLAIGVVGYFALIKPKTKLNTNALANSGVVVEEKGWQTYTDQIFGYSIQYPADWTHKAGAGYQAQFSPTAIVNSADASVGDLIYFYQGDVFIDVFENPDNKSTDAYVASQTKDPLERETITVGNKPATFYKSFCPFRESGAPSFAISEYPFCEGSVLVPQDGYFIAIQYGPTDDRNNRAIYGLMVKTFLAPVDPTTNWVTEKNSRFGYTFKHPAMWKLDRYPDVAFGIIAHDLAKQSLELADEPHGAFVVFNNGGAQRSMSPGGITNPKGGSTLPELNLDGIPSEVMKVTYWNHGLGVNPVAGSPGPGFYHETLEIDYIPKDNSRLPSSWGSSSWIALYPDGFGELTVPRMILKTFAFDGSLVGKETAATCPVLTDQQKFDQADVVALVTLKSTSPADTRADVQTWYKMKRFLEPKLRPYGVAILPTDVMKTSGDIVWQVGKQYLVYLHEERSTPYPMYTADRCAGTREFDGSLTTGENSILRTI